MRHGWSLSSQPRARKDRACALARRERTFHRMILDLMVADAGLGSLDIDGGLVSTRIANAAFGTKRRSVVQRSPASVAMMSKNLLKGSLCWQHNGARDFCLDCIGTHGLLARQPCRPSFWFSVLWACTRVARPRRRSARQSRPRERRPRACHVHGVNERFWRDENRFSRGLIWC